LEKEKINFKGFIFIGLMNKDGDPYVIEYNVRMGDPETEAVLPRIESDFLLLLNGIATGKLSEYELMISPHYSATVVMVSGGYPGYYEKGFIISLPNEPRGSVIFHAGTGIDKNGNLVNQGGRVLAVTGFGSGLKEALEHAFSTANQISWEKAYFRKDIGQDILKLM
jgi:phosphoribosylamine---glycine ligase